MSQDLFKVVKVIDKQTIEVSPRWKWKEDMGNKVNISPQIKIETDFYLDRLKTILNDRDIELKNPIRIADGIIHCFIFLNGVNIKNYFPELQPH